METIVTEIDLTNSKIAILGMGATGLSVARFLSSLGTPFVFADSREQPPNLNEVRDSFPQVSTQLGEFNEALFADIDLAIISPGIALDQSALIKARQKGVTFIGDLDLFLDQAEAPVVAITGSNGKSTVTTLLGEMAKNSGLQVGVGGNLGLPMLDLLSVKHQLYVLELSSFQLELLTSSRGATVGLLNVTPDHMDRYKDLDQYVAAKHHIFRGAKYVISNRQDSLTAQREQTESQTLTFGLDRPSKGNFGLAVHNHQESLFYGSQVLLSVEEVAMKGRHNIGNALAALALGHAAGLPIVSMLETLRTFKGLPHRCEAIATIDNVSYINDSKGTNIGATLAAIEGFGSDSYKNLLLIAGGQGKGQDFDGLKEAADSFVKCGFLYGEDAQQLEDALHSVTKVYRADSLVEAVAVAKSAARPGDIVLLSPACASFDSFTGFEERGHCFSQAVLSPVKTGSREGMTS
ncbi:MAG: UDP-N-acetylmuramoyl-L-alanine--D-glutamate ligase [Porticoccaceae bacterium]|jgi:UDP-N-acetylmuramoylalanine--D-glutamate ligase|nr:UDP-N-acetylmuramoyl-L-alanine--D-glutamate ligase [Porticoccaceae bacterium]MBT4164766.1 UDP-N-acetylmuramoyl-L-alanine--D-glutamate ligase [Porticoccaceae bacterium]MBT4591785.1 UDP-N-acetylmuramoyl-L-alanine--D-glutamate ligase [Porticoccaceae bacterium]MBT5004734.1 UDP-N-acetylmuramoyl-L-alanine--D-glutamate ligase [Porticoccaceae bacterium]MBT5104415.1 UDP-N-acetylmuramoyl-L-alanine--D-glutamate ligase [Porticoccaceae bacterium]